MNNTAKPNNYKSELTNFFYPKSIAIIGTSDRLESVGRTISENLSSYSGAVYFINPRLSGCKLFRRDIYKSILNLPESVDLCFIAVPTKIILSVMQEVAKTKCKNIVMITSGFNEIGKDKLTSDLKLILEKNNINLVGPNCLGLLNLENNLNGTFNSKEKLSLPQKGNVSIISQSGALGIAILDLASYEGLRLNKFVSYGNALLLDECDLLSYLGNDKDTQVILIYIEGIKDGRRFIDVLTKVSQNKKVIILKGGISKRGSDAAKSHTAAIAGDNIIFSTAIKQAGAYEVSSINEMFNLAKIFSNYKNKINNIQIITNGGGLGVLTSDQLDINKINLAELSSESITKIKKIVPEYAIVKNPIDLTGDATTERFIEVTKICLADKKVDSIVLLLLFQLPSLTKNIVEELEKLKRSTSKPIFIVSIGGVQTKEFTTSLEKNGVVCFSDPKYFAESIMKLTS